MAPPSLHIEDWLSRVTIPDVYPRRDDPFRPSPGIIPSTAPPASMVSADQLITVNVWDDWLTTPGTRPIVYQRALNFQISAGTTPLPLTNGNMQVEGIILDVDSTIGNSAFFGFSSSITTGSGIEVRPGLPIFLSVDNVREQWEVQRVLEAIAGMIAGAFGYNGLGAYRAPRVVFDASDFFIVAASTTTVRIMLFLTPEYQ